MIHSNIQTKGFDKRTILETLLDSIIVLLILVKYILNFCFSKKIGFGKQMVWLIAEIVLV
jgi:hypothetical protein